jgi:hypothetical protein
LGHRGWIWHDVNEICDARQRQIDEIRSTEGSIGVLVLLTYPMFSRGFEELDILTYKPIIIDRI